MLPTNQHLRVVHHLLLNRTSTAVMWLIVLTRGGGGGTFLKVVDATGYELLEYVLVVTAIGIFGT